MTNILASIVIAIVTNTTYWSNESGCKICSQMPFGISVISTPAIYHSSPIPCQPYKPATEKTETTTIKEVRTISFVWEGETYTAQRESIISTRVKKWTLKEDWVEEGGTK